MAPPAKSIAKSVAFAASGTDWLASKPAAACGDEGARPICRLPPVESVGRSWVEGRWEGGRLREQGGLGGLGSRLRVTVEVGGDGEARRGDLELGSDEGA